MGLVKLDIALSRKKPIESRIDLRRFPGMEHPLLDLFQPQVTRFVSFNPLRTEGFFFWDGGGGGWTFLSRKIAGLHSFFAARLQAGVESLARRFWSRKFHERRTPHSLVGRRLGMAKGLGTCHSRGGNFNEMTWNFMHLVPMALGARVCLHIANVRQFHLFCQPGLEEARGHAVTGWFMMILILSRCFSLMISTWLKSCKIQPSIHQLWVRAFTQKSCMSLYFLRKNRLSYLYL